MTPTKKEQIVKGVASLVAAGIVIGITNDPCNTTSCLSAFLASTLGNWAATLSLDSVIPTFKKFWLKNPETNVSDHINTALVTSWLTTMDEILIRYQDIHRNLSDHETQSLKSFIEELKSISANEFINELNQNINYDAIYTYVSSDYNRINNFLNERFYLTQRLNSFSDQYYLTENFIQYFIHEVPKIFHFHFRKELIEGKEAKQALDLLYFQTIRELVFKISSEQAVQIGYLQEIDKNIKESFHEDFITKNAILSVVDRLQAYIIQQFAIFHNNINDILLTTSSTKTSQQVLIEQNKQLIIKLENQGKDVKELLRNNSNSIKIDNDVSEFVQRKNFFKDIDFSNKDLIETYEKVEENIKNTIDNLFIAQLLLIGSPSLEEHGICLKGENFLLQTSIGKGRYLEYTMIPSNFSSAIPLEPLIEIENPSIGLIQGVRIIFPKDNYFINALLPDISKKISKVIFHIYLELEKTILNKVRKLESICIRGIRKLIEHEFKYRDMDFNAGQFNFTITYLQNNGATPCCYQLDNDSLENLIKRLKELPHPYYSAFVLILGYASMQAPDEFILRYGERMRDGVSYDNIAHSLNFYPNNIGYNILFELEKLFYQNQHLFNIEICRYNNFILEVTMDHLISDSLKKAICSLKIDLEDQFKSNIDNHQEFLDSNFFKNFNIHGEKLLAKVRNYFPFNTDSTS